jgi:hypothetical protein
VGNPQLCAPIVVTYSNFPSGGHTVQCFSSSLTGMSSSYMTSTSPSDVCQVVVENPNGNFVVGYAYVTVDGVESNHIMW